MKKTTFLLCLPFMIALSLTSCSDEEDNIVVLSSNDSIYYFELDNNIYKNAVIIDDNYISYLNPLYDNNIYYGSFVTKYLYNNDDEKITKIDSSFLGIDFFDSNNNLTYPDMDSFNDYIDNPKYFDNKTNLKQYNKSLIFDIFKPENNIFIGIDGSFKYSGDKLSTYDLYNTENNTFEILKNKLHIFNNDTNIYLKFDVSKMEFEASVDNKTTSILKYDNDKNKYVLNYKDKETIEINVDDKDRIISYQGNDFNTSITYGNDITITNNVKIISNIIKVEYGNSLLKISDKIRNNTYHYDLDNKKITADINLFKMDNYQLELSFNNNSYLEKAKYEKINEDLNEIINSYDVIYNNDNIEKIIYFSGDDDVIYYLNKDNRIIEIDNDNYKFNLSGYVIKSIYDIKNNIDTVYKFDKYYRIEEIIHNDTNKIIYEYDDINKLIKITNYDNYKDSSSNKITIIKDYNGNIIE